MRCNNPLLYPLSSFHTYTVMKLSQYSDYEGHRRDHEAIADDLLEIVHRFEKLDQM